MAAAALDPQTQLASAGVPAASVWTANDSELLTGATASDVEAAIRAAQDELLEAGREHARRARKSQAKRQQLADRVLQAGGHELLARVRGKLQEHGIELPTVQVEFRGVRVKTDALFGSAGIPTVGSIPLQLLKRVAGRRQKQLKEITVLGGPGGPLSGVLKPGRMTLLLGPPGCGKTTLLRVLSSRLRGCETLNVEGEVRYNGCTKNEFSVERVAAYVEQTDNHLGNLTVEETLSFAHTCMQGKAHPNFDIQREILEAKAAKSMHSLHQRMRVNGGSSAPGSGTVTPPGGAAEASSSSNLAEQLKAAARAQLQEDEVEALLRDLCGPSSVRVELIMRWMGLAHVRASPVGDAMTRGLSGGERKRLTTAEMLVSGRRVLMLDEINTGLDSATLHSVVTFLALMTRGLEMTTLISLLQPSPEVVALFDDVMLMADGAIIYHGPVSEAVPHFAAMGFDCPPRKDVASFLQEVSTPAGQHTYASQVLRQQMGRGPGLQTGALDRGSLPQSLVVPVDVLAQRFREESRCGIEEQRELTEAPFRKERGHPDALPKGEFALCPLDALRVVTRRQVKLLTREKAVLQGRIMQVTVIGLIVGSLFFRLGTGISDARSKMGASFLVVMFLSMGGMVQVALVIASRGVWFKHRDAKFYPAWCHGLAMSLSQLPITICEVVVFSSIVYWMMGYAADAGRFFLFAVTLGSTSLCVSSIFRLIAVAVPTPTLINAVSGLSLLILIMTSGFTIVRPNIPPWWIWAYWISPFSWAVRAVAVNEFTHKESWGMPVGPGTSLTVGDAVLDTFGLFHEGYWVGAGIGYLLGLYVLLSLALIFALGRVTGGTRRAQIPDLEEIASARAAAEKLRAAASRGPTPGARRHAKGLAPAAGRLPVAAGATITGVQAVVQIKSPAGPPAAEGEAAHGEKSTLPAAAKYEAAGGSGVPLPQLRLPAPGAAGLFVDASLQFEPITLAFRDIRYFVPNPAYRKRAAVDAAKQEAARQGTTTAGGDVELGGVRPAASAGQHQQSVVPGGPEGAGEADAASKLAATPELELLKGITGYVRPGELLALMGGSGAGKTTLADVLCGRKTVGRTTGSILVNGHAKDQDTWARVVGYVEQNDIHTAATTVLEALWFAARLRTSAPAAEVRASVVEVLDLVDLSAQAQALVGDPAGPGGGTGLSTEQRKRLTIATELVAQPSCVFMDEPTSGLDARSAAVVMRAVRNIGHSGRTVIVTIHQPSIELFEAFDSLLLLQRGGRTTYFGPLGHESSTLVAYLSRVPGTQPLRHGQNPATWMLEVTGGSMATIAATNDVDWPSLYEASPEANAAASEVERLEADGLANCAPLAMSSVYAQTFGVQLLELFKKYNKVYWRTPSYNFARILMTFLVSWIYGTNYYQAAVMPNPATMATIQNVMGVLFSSTSFLGMTNLMAIMPVCGAERVVYYRESGAKPYNVFAYGAALALVELPWICAQAVIFAPTLYFMVGFQADAEKFWHYFCMFITSLYYFTVFGQFLVWATPSQQLAQVLAGTVAFIMNITNGFVISYYAMPVYWRWVNRIVPTTWVLYGIASSQLSDVRVPFSLPGTPPGTFTVSSFMEKAFGYEGYMRWWCVLIVGANMIFYRVASVLVLRYVSYLKR